jgi:ParB-like chromosome segregation protein Spo0J
MNAPMNAPMSSDTNAVSMASVTALASREGPSAISLDSIRPGPLLRAGGINEAHVAALAEVSDGWPPIIVTEDHMLVDGHHRFAAARLLELERISAVVFRGSRADAYVEAVRSNVWHGMPLTLSERRQAGRQILEDHPTWSDRRIALSCGLSARTIKTLRDESEPSDRPPMPRVARVGSDGRLRPVEAGVVRAAIVAELERRPTASLRAVARSVGASPETVRSVRNQLQAQREWSSVVLDAELDVGPPISLPKRDDREVTVGQDPAFISCADGARFAAWFDELSVPCGDLWTQVGAVPLSRVYLVADESRRRAKFWADFADAVESRVRH